MTLEDKVLTNEVHIKCLSNSIKNLSTANAFRASAVKDAPSGRATGNRNPGRLIYLIRIYHIIITQILLSSWAAFSHWEFGMGHTV